MAVDKIFDELGKMSVLELVELKDKIEEEWGVTAAAPVAVAAPGGAAPGDRASRPAQFLLCCGEWRSRSLQFRPISAIAAASACGEGGRSGTLAGCAVARPLAALTPISCPFSHASREAVLLDHHGRFA